ncbi:MAG: ribosomal RNA small subunit methyltransferase A [Candidatus Sericytochromatia bacterium]|nr:MAG: ribosomal RNA small subunit methyltransferase A [Candidatus Sericytochromatia bacterium]
MTKYYNNLPVRKRFGQNFLINKFVIDEIINKSNITSNDFVLEIGPGHGYLTEKIQKLVKNVFAVEIDRDLYKNLKDKFKECSNIDFVNEDFLKLELSQIDFKNIPFENRKVVANIPYYITTPIIMKLANEKIIKREGLSKSNKYFSEIIIMLQKEVADRILAKKGTKEYGSLSLICQYAFDIEKLISVDKTCFYPIPKVDSTVIKMKTKLKDDFNIVNHEIMWKIINGVFTSRRKSLRNSLKIAGLSDKDIEKVSLYYDLSIRGEELEFRDFVKISNLIGDIS